MAKQKILLIDYDPTSISRLVQPLTQAGYAVEVAKDGIEGLAAYGRLKPDLVMVEAMLPRKHGFEVCQEIKRSPDGERTAVMITTAVCRGRKYRTDALQIYGCDEYVEKPIPDEELLSICRRLLSEIDKVSSGNGGPPKKSPARPDAPALDEMTDEEIELRLDSLLVDPDDPPAATRPQESKRPAPEPPPAPKPARAAPSSELPDLAKMSEDEIMSRLDSLVDGSTASATEPEPGPELVPTALEAEPVSVETEAAAPAVEPLPVVEKEEAEDQVEGVEEEEAEPAPRPVVAGPAAEPPPVETEPAIEEPLEEPLEEPRRGKSRIVWIAAATVVALLAGAAVLGWSQGWFSGEPAPARVEQRTPSDATPPPTFSSERFRARIAEAAVADAQLGETAPVELESPQPEPVTTAPPPQVAEAEPAPPPETVVKQAAAPPEVVEQPPAPRRKAKPKPLVEPDPEVTAAVREEILSEPVEDLGAERPTDLAQPPEAFLGAPVRPTLPGELVELAEVDTRPVAVDRRAPVYDPVARRLRQEGTVVLNLLIDETGKVEEVELLSGIARSRLNDAAVRAAKRWRYRPAQKGGVPVKVWKSEKIVFKL